MTGFGQQIRRERERLGVSLEGMCRDSKVNSRHFEALEREEYDRLPGGVFRRGIVRAYLASAGLEAAVWMPGFEASLAAYAAKDGRSAEAGDERWAQFAENVGRTRQRQKKADTVRWLGVLALFLLVAAGAWAVWHFELRPRVAHEAVREAKVGQVLACGVAGVRVE